LDLLADARGPRRLRVAPQLMMRGEWRSSRALPAPDLLSWSREGHLLRGDLHSDRGMAGTRRR
jgi:hypothetical protein